MLTRVADFLEPLLTQTPPDPFGGLGDLWKLGQTRPEVPQARPATSATEAVEILTGAATPILDRWFESERTEGDDRHRRRDRRVRRRRRIPGTAYVLFHHVMGECNGVRGVWGYVRGGMGTISEQHRRGREEPRGRDPHERRRSASILVKDGRATGVALEDGTEFHAKRVASSADANVTFLKLMDPKDLPAEFVAAVKRIDYSSATVKINVALSEPPHFKACPAPASARSTTARCTSARHGLHRAGLRRRQVRQAGRATRCSNARWRRPSTTRSPRRASTS